jgi:uncharacterized protein (TIGR02145 family)
MRTRKHLEAILCLLIGCCTLSAQEYGSYTDPRDGREYLTVQIGQQQWMAENMAYESESPGAIYREDTPFLDAFGRYYSWEVALEVCPEGWHLPSEDEWDLLAESLGGHKEAGGKMKRISMYWTAEIDSTSNSSGFSALPAGFMETPEDVTFTFMGDLGLFWTAGEKNRSDAFLRYVDIESDHLKDGSGGKESGLSVRCLKD